MAGISSKAAGSLTNKNQYNGKEKQSNEFSDGSGLETYDFGARQYDQQTGRWGVTDPKSDMYSSYSPYNYCLNNPLKYIDPNGEDVYLLIWYSDNGEIGHTGFAADNYKTVEKKDKKGNVIYDKKGNAKTEQVKDGTVTYYDFWPGSAGKKNAGENQDGHVQKFENLSLDDLKNKDFGTGEKRAAEGVIQITAGVNETNKTKDYAEQQYQDQRKNDVQYNGISNNCSNFALDCLKQIKDLPNFFGRENINTDGNKWLGVPATNSYSVTPNFLYRHSAAWINNKPSIGKVLKSDTKKAGNDFVNAVTSGWATDKTPGY